MMRIGPVSIKQDFIFLCLIVVMLVGLLFLVILLLTLVVALVFSVTMLGTADVHIRPFFPAWIPLVQGMLLLSGLYLGVSRGYHGLARLIPDSTERTRAVLLPALFALGVTSLFLKLYMG